MLPFIDNLLNTLLWCCLFLTFTQFVILENLLSLDLALPGVKEFIKYIAIIQVREFKVNYFHCIFVELVNRVVNYKRLS